MINVSKLENVVVKDGKTIARCPACKAQGGDAKGEHLVVYPSGKFGCIKYPNDKNHRRQIHKLVGGAKQQRKITVKVKPLLIEESKIISNLGHLGR